MADELITEEDPNQLDLSFWQARALRAEELLARLASEKAAGGPLPKKDSTRELWRRIYKAMCRLDRIYGEDPELDQPGYADYSDYLKVQKHIAGYRGRGYSERTLRAVKRAGRAGLLD